MLLINNKYLILKKNNYLSKAVCILITIALLFCSQNTEKKQYFINHVQNVNYISAYHTDVHYSDNVVLENNNQIIVNNYKPVINIRNEYRNNKVRKTLSFNIIISFILPLIFLCILSKKKYEINNKIFGIRLFIGNIIAYIHNLDGKKILLSV